MAGMKASVLRHAFRDGIKYTLHIIEKNIADIAARYTIYITLIEKEILLHDYLLAVVDVDASWSTLDVNRLTLQVVIARSVF